MEVLLRGHELGPSEFNFAAPFPMDPSFLRHSTLPNMASPFKRLCIRTATSKPLRSQQLRPISSTASANADIFPSLEPSSNSSDGTDLDALTSRPDVEYTIMTSADTPSSLQGLQNMDMSSRAHHELNAHRELREMMRLAAWEMPLLAQYAKPFVSPGKPQTQENILRWRYTTYINETHPASRKVVVEFNTLLIPDLSPQQRLKLEKLAGPRLHTSGKGRIVKMSCESFETVAQNKRYLAETITNLIAEAKDPKSDTFEDVPLDLRHRRVKKKYKFPMEWRMTEERRKELERKRKQALLSEGRRVELGSIVSGVAAIEAAREQSLQDSEAAMMAEARRGMDKGKMGKKEMGQFPGKRR